MAPIISWIHHEAEAFATEEDRRNYIEWWTKVAEKLKRRKYRLSFNLFTELGIDECGDNCQGSLREDTIKYNKWTSEVVRAIRNTSAKNAKRILILTSPTKRHTGLPLIENEIYNNDDYTMVEWHDYAAGPNQKSGSRRYWSENGSDEQRSNLITSIKQAKDFALLSYFGAWMPQDNESGSLNEEEVISFARFFASELKKDQIPWSLNVLDVYYNTEQKTWNNEEQNIKEANLNMSKVLENVRAVM